MGMICGSASYNANTEPLPYVITCPGASGYAWVTVRQASCAGTCTLALAEIEIYEDATLPRPPAPPYIPPPSAPPLTTIGWLDDGTPCRSTCSSSSVYRCAGVAIGAKPVGRSDVSAGGAARHGG